MAFCGPVLAKSAMGGPVAFAVTGCALAVGLLGYAVVKVALGNARNNSWKPSIVERQDRGDMDSSDVEKYLNLGTFGTYEYLINNKRPFSKGKDGDKYYVEADHIPPLDSLRRAAQEPEFRTLRIINKALYDMVRSLENHSRGMNLFTLQVPTHHHRVALSTGSSRESVAVRGVLARRIARGEAVPMLKQAMMIAHPFVSETIREKAGIRRSIPKERSRLSRDRTMNYYRGGFLGLINFMYERGVITWEEEFELREYVLNHGYFDINSSEYQEILETTKRSLKRRSQYQWGFLENTFDRK